MRFETSLPDEFPLNELEIGVRTFRCLERNGFRTVGDVVSKTHADLLRLDNFGRISFDDLVAALTPEMPKKTLLPKQIDAEHVKAMASACFGQLMVYRQSQGFLQEVINRHWDHPAFRAYMRDMGLKDAFGEFRK